MQDGIYHVSFSASTGDSGQGLVVIKDGAVNGGDYSHLYTGQLKKTGTSVTGRFNVKCWNPEGISVFGKIDNFDLDLRGQANSADSFTISGGIVSSPQHTIQIDGRFLSPTA